MMRLTIFINKFEAIDQVLENPNSLSKYSFMTLFG